MTQCRSEKCTKPARKARTFGAPTPQYCSKSCSAAESRRRHRLTPAQREALLPVLTCAFAECDGTFRQINGQLYCTPRCRLRHNKVMGRARDELYRERKAAGWVPNPSGKSLRISTPHGHRFTDELRCEFCNEPWGEQFGDGGLNLPVCRK